ncbi:MAG TPA: inorganic diphosphatase [Planctomycetota bacterium]|nr:inorganic diphosphatase [Planctomycetota bacterium]
MLSALAPGGRSVHVVVDSPRASRSKYKRDERLGLFKLRHVLPEGLVFPYDFGYVPGTRGEDGDPIDVMLLDDEPAFVGCVVEARLIGVIEARQREEGERRWKRNDRLLAVAIPSAVHAHLRELRQLPSALLDELENFFVSYTRMEGKTFQVRGRRGRSAALQALARGRRAFERG